jgi:two-component system CheB/CheR fusion protein
MNATEIATLFLDRNLNIQRFTSAATALFDLRDADVGRSLGNLTRRFAEKDLVDEARRVLREGVALEREVRRGSDEWYLAKLRPYRTVDDETTGVVLTFVDITERRLLERQLVNNTEKVRRQIGQDLHDILSSDLAALAMKIDNYRTRLAKKEGVDARPLADLAESAREAAEQSRTLSHALVPVTLREENLAATLENLCREQGELADLELAFEGDRDEQLPRDKETAMHLYRIAHEAVINARRHAEARQVRIRLGRTDGCMEMVVRDDGIGMPDALDEAEGLGLRTMRYRANLIGASLSFGTGDDHGAVVRCGLPLAKARE